MQEKKHLEWSKDGDGQQKIEKTEIYNFYFIWNQLFNRLSIRNNKNDFWVRLLINITKNSQKYTLDRYNINDNNTNIDECKNN